MYRGLREPDRWILPAVIEEQAEARGDSVFVAMAAGGPTLTYRDLRDQAAKVAAMLAAAGAKRGDRIALMLPGGFDFLRAWAGIGRLGAVSVILNSDLIASFLIHPLRDSGASVLIVDATRLPLVEEVRDQLPNLKTVLVAESDGSFAQWRNFAPIDHPLPAARDLASIMYTSGTTGPPKGVLMPHAHCFLFGLGVIDNLGVDANDVYYVCLPLSHANGLLMQLGSVLIAGARATVREKFSASSWLDDIRASGATVTHTLGALNAFIVAQPSRPEDRQHRLRLILTVPNHPEHERFWRERFGIAEVIGGYGMTEVNIPLYVERGKARPGTCGRLYSRYFDVEIRDPDTGNPVGVGKAGEIVVRPRAAHAFMAGYNNLPEKTVETWRDLWFHTGDVGSISADGYVTFIDRIKDCIRRRGENISATDIEVGIATLPGVAEVAAYAVPSEILGGEDEIMLSIVRQPGTELRPQEVSRYARANMPRFAQPRFVAFVSSLPKTATQKVRKDALRATGITEQAIDLHRLDMNPQEQP